MSKIPKRFQIYFKYAVGFKCKIIPPPKTPSELHFITESFRNLATVDILKTTPLHSEALVDNKVFQVDILFSPIRKKSVFLPLSIDDEEAEQIFDSHPRNVVIRDKLKEKLLNLISIPRYLYVENDEMFSGNQRLIQFVHELSSNGRDLLGKYDLSLGTIENPFISLTKFDPSLNEKLDKFRLRRAIRNDVQHFHKLQDIEIYTNHTHILHKLETNTF